jgi:hypothetical protein
MRIIVRNAQCSLQGETNTPRFTATELAGYMGFCLTSSQTRFGYNGEDRS